MRPECESSRAEIACGQLRAVCTAERRGWHWPTNKDARRWPVRWLPRWPKAYLYALSGSSQVRALDLITASAVFGLGLVWPGWRSDREGKYMYEYSTEYRLRVLLRTAVPMWRVGRALPGGRAVGTRLRLARFARLWVGCFLDHGWLRRKAYFNMHSCVCSCVEQSTPDPALNSAVKTPNTCPMS